MGPTPPPPPHSKDSLPPLPLGQSGIFGIAQAGGGGSRAPVGGSLFCDGLRSRSPHQGPVRNDAPLD